MNVLSLPESDLADAGPAPLGDVIDVPEQAGCQYCPGTKTAATEPR